MAIRTYTQDELAAQPIGYWGAAASRMVVAEIRAALAVERLTQPHWWILNHVAGAPGTWQRAGLTARLAPFDDQDTDFAAVFDDLTGRGWLAADGGGSQPDRGVSAGAAGSQPGKPGLSRRRPGRRAAASSAAPPSGPSPPGPPAGCPS